MLSLRSPVPPGDGGLLLLAASRRPIETKLANLGWPSIEDAEADFLLTALTDISKTIMQHRAVLLEGARVQLDALIEWNGCDGYTMAGIQSVLSVVERELARQGRA